MDWRYLAEHFNNHISRALRKCLSPHNKGFPKGIQAWLQRRMHMVLSFQFADTVFTAVEQYKTDTSDANHPQTVSDGWFVTCSDAHSGESATAKNVTMEQLHAIVSLAMGSGEEHFLTDELCSQLYFHAEKVVSKWANTVCPIP